MMPRSFRSHLLCALATLVAAAIPARAGAQAAFSQTVRTTLSVSVPGVAGIAAVSAPRVRASATRQVELSATVTVKANAPYRVTAHLAAPELVRDGVRVWVRDASGQFRRLDETGMVSVVEYGLPGAMRPSQVIYRIEAGSASQLRAASRALRYEARVEQAPPASAVVTDAAGAA